MAIVARDMRQMRRHGLWLMVFLSVILFVIGFVGLGLVGNQLREWGTRPGWTESLSAGAPVEGDGGVPFTLLDAVYGYSVLVTMFLVPVAFVTSYNHEMKKGTVRVLTLYPVGVFGITIAKLLYAALAGLIFSVVVVVVPFARLGREADVQFSVFLVAYLFSLGTVAMGAFLGDGITFVTGKMRIRPTSFALLLALFSFFFTETIIGAAGGLVASLLGLPDGGSIVQALGPLVFLSSYHQGGLLLSATLGGPGFPEIPAFLITAILLAAGIWSSRRLYPDIYERE